MQDTHNNAAERALRSVCLGKKNWLCVSRRRTPANTMRMAA
ncbi:transposase [Salmonella enterica]|nr:transposase [Salmonella enterica]EGZ8045685.1 transposase [Salmonella enterica]